MTYFNECKNINEIKATYRTLAMQFHPDKNVEDTTAIMQLINREYAFAIAKMLQGDTNLTADQVDEEVMNANAYREAINKIINLPNITVELCGGWLWVSGNTYAVRATLKEAGFYWAPKKEMWYFRSPDYAVKSHKAKSMEDIRNKYGSQKIAMGKSNFLS